MSNSTLSQADLAEIFPVIWCKESSAFSDRWTPMNPAYGQCYATARITATVLGGYIICRHLDLPGLCKGVIHFVNHVDGVDIDFTESQFSGLKPVVTSERLWTIRGDAQPYERIFPAVGERLSQLIKRFEQHTECSVLV